MIDGTPANMSRIVPPTQPGVPVTFDYADESDRVPYPIPANVPIEAGSDRHALIVQEGGYLCPELGQNLEAVLSGF